MPASPSAQDVADALAMTLEREDASGAPWCPPSDAAALRKWVTDRSASLGTGIRRAVRLARLMAVVANDGWLVTPHVVRGFGPSLSGEDSSASLSRPAPERLADLDEDTLARIREGLERVVAHPQGTGYKHVRLDEVAIAGKTGTAEVGGGKPDHAWFAGYVPAENPRVAFVVVLEHAGSGGHAAGPVAREFVQALAALGLLGERSIAAPLAN